MSNTKQDKAYYNTPYYHKPSEALSAIIKAGLMTQCGSEITDIVVHHIKEQDDGTCELALEVYKTVKTVVEGSEQSSSIVFKNLKLTKDVL